LVAAIAQTHSAHAPAPAANELARELRNRVNNETGIVALL
jgi:hypothetical protein